MQCSQCAGIEEEFNEVVARRELVRYRRRGVGGTTRLLIDALKDAGLAGQTLLDIGGGAGIIQHELVAAGVDRVTSVDASSAYLQVQQDEAARRGYAARAEYLSGDFVAVASQVPAADLVTLDRVICCYHDMPALVGASASRARRFYGIVIPRDTWWNALAFRVLNFVMRLRRTPFRTFLHPIDAIDAAVRKEGLRRRAYLRDTLVWRVAVYAR